MFFPEFATLYINPGNLSPEQPYSNDFPNEKLVAKKFFIKNRKTCFEKLPVIGFSTVNSDKYIKELYSEKNNSKICHMNWKLSKSLIRVNIKWNVKFNGILN